MMYIWGNWDTLVPGMSCYSKGIQFQPTYANVVSFPLQSRMFSQGSFPWSWCFQRLPASYFLNVCPFGLSDLLYDWSQVVSFPGISQKSHVLIMPYQVACDFDFLIAGDVSFDHLIKVMSTRLLYCEATLLLFVINKYFVGRFSKLLSILLPIKRSIYSFIYISM